MYKNQKSTILQAANILYVKKPLEDIVLVGQIRKEFIKEELRLYFALDFDEKAVDRLCYELGKQKWELIVGQSLDRWNYKERDKRIPKLLYGRYWDRNNELAVGIFKQRIGYERGYEEFTFAIRNRGVSSKDSVRLQELIVREGKITNLAPFIKRNKGEIRTKFGNVVSFEEREDEIEPKDYWKKEYNSDDWERLSLPEGAEMWYDFENREEAYKFIPRY